MIKNSFILPKQIQDYCPDPEKYNHYMYPLKQSKPRIPMDVLLEATKPVKPFPWDKETDMKIGQLDKLVAVLAFMLFKLSPERLGKRRPKERSNYR